MKRTAAALAAVAVLAAAYVPRLRAEAPAGGTPQDAGTAIREAGTPDGGATGGASQPVQGADDAGVRHAIEQEILRQNGESIRVRKLQLSKKEMEEIHRRMMQRINEIMKLCAKDADGKCHDVKVSTSTATAPAAPTKK